MSLSKKLLTSVISLGAISLLLGGCANHNKSTATHHATRTVVSTNHKSTSKPKHHKSVKKASPKVITTHSNVAKKPSQSVANNSHNNSNNNRLTHKSDNLSSMSGTINIINGIVGHIDHGAGQTYITFKANGHNFIVHGTNFGNGNAIALAKARSVALNSAKIPANQKQVNVDATI